MENEVVLKGCPESAKQKTESDSLLDKQICVLARSLRTCVNEIKKASYLYKGQICNDLQQTVDFRTLLHTVREHISKETADGAETCRKYLMEASDSLNEFKGLMDFVNNHCDTDLKVVYEEENDADVSWVGKRECALHEKGLIGRRKEDGSWDMDNCRWTFEDCLLFQMGFKSCKGLIR